MAGRLRRWFDITSGEGEIEGRFGLRRFTQSAGVISISTIASFVRAVITAKLLAVTLGPSAVGILAQLFNFSALMSNILPLGLTAGVSKLVAEGGRDNEQVNRVVVAASTLSLASGLAGAIILTPVAEPLSTALTGSPKYTVAVLLLVWSFPLYNLAGVIGYFLQGFAEIQKLTWASVLTSAFALAALIPLTLAYGVTGVIESVLLTSVAQTLFYGFEVWRAYAARGWRLAGAALSTPVVRELLQYGWVLLVASVLPWAAVLLVRTLTLHTLSGFANGLYQVVFGLSTQYITIFLTWMAAYVFPRVVSEARSGKLNQLLNSGLRANLALMVPIFVVSIALREPLIRLFYSGAFVGAAPLIPVQVLGDYLRVIGWSFAICLIAVGRTRSHLALIAAQNTLWVVLAVLLVPVWGLMGVAASYSLSFLMYPTLGVALVRHWVGAAPDRQGLLLSILGLACVIGALAPFYTGVLLAPVMPAVVYFMNRRELRLAAARPPGSG